MITKLKQGLEQRLRGTSEVDTAAVEVPSHLRDTAQVELPGFSEMKKSLDSDSAHMDSKSNSQLSLHKTSVVLV